MKEGWTPERVGTWVGYAVVIALFVYLFFFSGGAGGLDGPESPNNY